MDLLAELIENCIPGFRILVRPVISYLELQPRLVSCVLVLCSLIWWLARRLSVSIRIHEFDPHNHYIKIWLMKQSNVCNSHALIAKEEVIDTSMVGEFTSHTIRPKPSYEPEFGVEYCVVWNKWPFWIERSQGHEMTYSGGWTTIKTYWTTTRPIQSLIEHCQNTRPGADERFIEVRNPGAKKSRKGGDYPWGDPVRRPQIPLHALIMDPTQKNTLIEALNQFVSAEYRDRALRLHIPYHLGLLLSGPPGTGKSTAIVMVATYLKLPVYYIPLSDFGLCDEELLRLFQTLPGFCIVVLEEIDSAFAARSRSEGMKTRFRQDEEGLVTQGVTRQGLLQVLDGLGSKEGAIVLMTTNYPNALSPEMKRTGRVDKIIEFSLPRQAQIKELFVNVFTDDDPTLELKQLALEFGLCMDGAGLSLVEIRSYLMSKPSPQEALSGGTELLAGNEERKSKDKHTILGGTIAESTGSRL